MTIRIKFGFLVALGSAVLLPYKLDSGVAYADDRDEYRYGYRSDFI